MADSEQPHSQARPWLSGLELQDVRCLLLRRRFLQWVRDYLPNLPMVRHLAENDIRLNISMMIKFQQPQRLQNQDTQKHEFNRFEKRRSLIILGLLGVMCFTVNLIIVIKQIRHCNAMGLRYVDIGNLSFLSALEIAVGAFFIVTVRSSRSITWVKTRVYVSPSRN
jgi:hypothetical protein